MATKVSLSSDTVAAVLFGNAGEDMSGHGPNANERVVTFRLTPKGEEATWLNQLLARHAVDHHIGIKPIATSSRGTTQDYTILIEASEEKFHTLIESLINKAFSAKDGKEISDAYAAAQAPAQVPVKLETLIETLIAADVISEDRKADFIAAYEKAAQASAKSAPDKAETKPVKERDTSHAAQHTPRNHTRFLNGAARASTHQAQPSNLR